VGSRRSYTLSAVVGKGRELASAKGALTRAIDAEDSDAIVAASAHLVAKSERAGDFFYYGLKLLDAVGNLAGAAKSLEAPELDKRLRIAWAQVKREHSVPDDPAVDKVVLDAAKQALGRGGR
jgi:hypothetical protein